MDLLKLLLVDDEKIILKGLLQTYNWEKMGYEVVGAARSGEEALALLEDEEPDVVLTDVRMKKISGLELMSRSKQTRTKTKYIVLSAYKDFEYAQKACEEGAISYLVKPVAEDELAAAMAKAYQICVEERRKEERIASYQQMLSQYDKGLLNDLKECGDQLAYDKDIKQPEEYLIGYIEQALNYVEEHLHEEEMSITTVAKVVFLNPAYFGRIFKNIMGMTFRKYLLKERMARAKTQLLESTNNVAEIGRNVGIPNPSYFAQLFKQVTGVQPSEYKKK